MGGSIVLNPLSPHYAALSNIFTTSHRNELYSEDALVLLNNSKDLFHRQEILDRNAKTIAEYLHSTIQEGGDSPVAKVDYPSLLPSKANYDKFMRRSTSEYPTRGYGCLLNVNFESVETAAAFYDRCPFYPSPHLGGHVSIMLCYNMFIWGRNPTVREYVRPLGILEESVRISAGLEAEVDLLDSVKEALEAAKFVKKFGREKAEEAGLLPHVPIPEKKE